MKTLDLAVCALSAALYVVFGYLFSAVLPITMPGLGVVRFWPQVIIPAVFAAIFGHWVGGIGAGIGIFISDMLLHGNPVLSLMAGVTSNFAGFWLIGYIARKKFDWKIPVVGFGVVSALLVLVSYIFLSAEEAPIYSGIIVASYVILLVFVRLTPKWRSYEVGSMVGLLVGSAIIGAMVPLFSQFFIMPGASVLTPMSGTAGFAWLIWTFATEIPFLLILGPPIVEAVYKAFPAFRPKEQASGSQ